MKQDMIVILDLGSHENTVDVYKRQPYKSLHFFIPFLINNASIVGSCPRKRL